MTKHRTSGRIGHLGRRKTLGGGFEVTTSLRKRLVASPRDYKEIVKAWLAELRVFRKIGKISTKYQNVFSRLRTLSSEETTAPHMHARGLEEAEEIWKEVINTYKNGTAEQYAEVLLKGITALQGYFGYLDSQSGFQIDTFPNYPAPKPAVDAAARKLPEEGTEAPKEAPQGAPQGAPQEAPEAAAAPAKDCWTRKSDETDTWFEKEGEASVWSLENDEKGSPRPEPLKECGIGGRRRRTRGGDKPLVPKPPGPNTNGLKPTGAPMAGRRTRRRRHPRRKTSRR